MEELGFPFEESYIRNQSFFDDELPEVVVWVESMDDKRLWMPVFEELQDKRFTFKFLTASSFKTEDGKSANGCNRVLKLCKSGDIDTGLQQIVCIDSDHRFLASFSEQYKGERLDEGHFYWTVVHSKENIEISVDSLDSVLQHVLCCPKNKLQQSAQEILEEFSRAISDCVYMLGFLEGKHWGESAEEFLRFKSDFRSAFAPLYKFEKKHSINFLLDARWIEFRDLCADLGRNLQDYISRFNFMEEYGVFLSQVLAAGVNPEKTYLFVRGHDLHAVTCSIFRGVCAAYKADMLADVRSGNQQTLNQRMKEFNNKWVEFDACLQARTPDISNVPFFDKTTKRLRVNYF